MDRKEQRKQRNEKRNRMLIKKFYELYDVKRLRMDDALNELADEHFFLDKDYIYTLIFYNKKNQEYYNQLCNNGQKN